MGAQLAAARTATAQLETQIAHDRQWLEAILHDLSDAVMVLDEQFRLLLCNARAHALLEPGGWLIAKVPLHGDWSLRTAGAVPRLAAPVLGVPVHVQFYTQESLDELLGPRFVQKRWIELGPMREGASGGRVRRRLARRVVRSIHALSGDGNLVVVAQRPRTSVATS
jgi:PAS domain-containing protein